MLVATWLLAAASLASAIPKWDMENGFLVDLLNEDKFEVENVLKLPTRFKDLPPILKKPKSHERSLKEGEIPQYVIDYAPFVHLYSEERYLPYDIKQYVEHFHAEFKNGTTVPGTENGQLNITNGPKLKE